MSIAKYDRKVKCVLQKILFIRKVPKGAFFVYIGIDIMFPLCLLCRFLVSIVSFSCHNSLPSVVWGG